MVGVPVLFFITGLHDNYHRPSDDFDKIEFGGLTRITDIVSDVTYELATLEQRPEYAETENRVRVRRQITAYMGVSLANRDDSVVISGLVQGPPPSGLVWKSVTLWKSLARRRSKTHSKCSK